jgi:hypothetical protein
VTSQCFSTKLGGETLFRTQGRDKQQFFKEREGEERGGGGVHEEKKQESILKEWKEK